MTDDKQVPAALQRLDDYELGRETHESDHRVTDAVTVTTNSADGRIMINKLDLINEPEDRHHSAITLTAKEFMACMAVVSAFMAENMDDPE